MIVSTRSPAVQDDERDCWIRCKEPCDVIENRIPDPGICTALAAAGEDHIPEGDPAFSQMKGPDPIRKITINVKEGLDNLPEVVPHVPVILIFQERLLAWKTAENEYFYRFTMDREETIFRAFHTSIRCVVHTIRIKKITYRLEMFRFV
jgi:hypothetical protein